MGFKKATFGLDEERPFNFAQLLLERLDKLFQKANESSVEADLNTWYNVLGTIKRAISFTDDEDLTKVNDKLKSMRGKFAQAQRTKDPAFYLTIAEDLGTTEELLVMIMFKHQLYYPHYEKKTWQQKAKEEDV